MQPLDFLGGKYRQSEQILPGPLQTFRAQEATTGRNVFVHRMSTAEDSAQQILLLRLLSLALLRSPIARSLILDISDEGGFWHVVTETEPQCLSLREWLQFEMQAAGETGGGVKRETVESEMPQNTALVEPKAVPGEPSQVISAKVEQPKPEPAQQEPGEFTRFFQAGLPGAKKSAQPDPMRGRDRPSNPDLLRTRDRATRTSGFVQRPNTPVPPLPQQPVPQRSAEPGEFTKIFSGRSPERASSEPKSDPLTPASLGALSPTGKSDVPDMFSTSAAMPVPAPEPPKAPGEYTRIFGKGNLPPIQEPSGLATQRISSSDDPLARNAPSPRPSPVGTKGPSEYTQVVQGARSQPASTGEAAPQQTNEAPPAAAPIPPINPGVAPPPMHMPPAPHAPPPPALPSAAGAVPVPANKKLLIFFSILAALAVLLVIVFVFATKK
ncbi:MAG: hypothetical protein JO145_03120 [Acidobacteriaceae bacterium]|nr:hypothetical protein [Acidobacteriaceae bacterium]